MKKFYVLNYDINHKKAEPYDILPYFRDRWNDKYFSKEKLEIRKSKSKEIFKKWIESSSQYQFWGRCEYEFLIASWPFGSYRLRQDMQEFLNNNPKLDLNDISQAIKFENIIIKDMQKIDIHEQIMMNIDIIADLLNEELHIY